MANLLKISRRKFLLSTLIGVPGLVYADCTSFEPRWLKVKKIRIAKNPSHRLAHVTDLHHKGDREYLEKVVARINSLAPDFICFTGDLIEDKRFLDDTLKILSTIKAPLYGCPGNHDYWSKADFSKIAKSFEATGGAWLVDKYATTADGKISISGAACRNWKIPPILAPKPGMKNVALFHYPLWVENVSSHQYDLMLAGHSHGGQVRIPFWGAPFLPWGVGRYEVGMFRTPSGPLYVNPGIGYIAVDVRFNCRPEITLFEI
jgi:predicted MPP superfamily phosphohydrolase